MSYVPTDQVSACWTLHCSFRCYCRQLHERKLNGDLAPEDSCFCGVASIRQQSPTCPKISEDDIKFVSLKNDVSDTIPPVSMLGLVYYCNVITMRGLDQIPSWNSWNECYWKQYRVSLDHISCVNPCSYCICLQYFKAPYMICVDHVKKAVVIAIRGTLSIKVHTP